MTVQEKSSEKYFNNFAAESCTQFVKDGVTPIDSIFKARDMSRLMRSEGVKPFVELIEIVESARYAQRVLDTAREVHNAVKYRFSEGRCDRAELLAAKWLEVEKATEFSVGLSDLWLEVAEKFKNLKL